MFKEFGVILIGFFTIYLILRWIYNKSLGLFQKVLVGLLVICLLLNIGYNLKYILPNFDYENVSLGDCKENLFTYKDDSEFQWQILFPILKERKVYLDESGSDYEKFFGLFAKDVERIAINPSVSEQISNDKEAFSTNIKMTLIELMNYAFESYDSAQYEDSHPFLRIHVKSLRGEDELVAIVDANKNLYLMSKSYYEAQGAK